jgi:hypothetical protein
MRMKMIFFVNNYYAWTFTQKYDDSSMVECLAKVSFMQCVFKNLEHG